jgi:hexosaminidase
MRENDWTSLTQVFQFFVTQADGIVRALDAGTRTPVHWQDVYDSSVAVDASDVYQVWRSTDDVGVLAKAGFDVVVSAQSTGWYLNCGFNPGCAYSSWEAVYQADILAGTDESDRHRIIGGEAVLFGEFANPASVDDQLWPRAAAVAERLWVSPAVNDTVEALPRLTAHACRLQAIGIGSAPTGPGYCDPSLYVAFV